MRQTALADLYRRYIACLNAQDWPNLASFVDEHAIHNGRPIGLSGYRAMLEQNYREIPDLQFNVVMLIADQPYIASRLHFDCHPAAQFLGLNIHGRRVMFTENVFYEFRDEKIIEVWSVLDTAAIEAQL